jgi:hypothetical protein
MFGLQCSRNNCLCCGATTVAGAASLHVPSVANRVGPVLLLLPLPPLLLLLLQQPMAMAKEFDLVSSWNSYITNSNILRVRDLHLFFLLLKHTHISENHNRHHDLLLHHQQRHPGGASTVIDGAPLNSTYTCVQQGRHPSNGFECIR